MRLVTSTGRKENIFCHTQYVAIRSHSGSKNDYSATVLRTLKAQFIETGAV